MLRMSMMSKRNVPFHVRTLKQESPCLLPPSTAIFRASIHFLKVCSFDFFSALERCLLEMQVSVFSPRFVTEKADVVLARTQPSKIVGCDQRRSRVQHVK
jgi:hypothetical protein